MSVGVHGARYFLATAGLISFVGIALATTFIWYLFF